MEALTVFALCFVIVVAHIPALCAALAVRREQRAKKEGT